MKRPSLDDIAASIAGYDPQSLSVEQARDFIARLVQPVADCQTIALQTALDRVLAQDVICPIDVPAHDNSAMDGFACRGSDLSAERATTLRVVGSALAGAPADVQVAAGQAVRITTGAVMPAGLDTVVPQEFATLEGDRVTVPGGVVRAGDNRRLRGEDLLAGKPAVAAGRVLRPAELGLIASLGVGEVVVRRRLRVAYFSTGDEIHSIGQPLSPGGVYDSNRYTVRGMLQRLGVDVLDLGVVHDDAVALEQAFRDAAANADVVITSGGVSVGEADHTKQVMSRLGDVRFWRIAMRPGRPMALGTVGQAVLFGLPGNPVAVMVTFYAFVRDALLRMAGASPRPLPIVRARCLTPVRKKPGRTEYQRGVLSTTQDGDLAVTIMGNQGSGVLRSMSEGDALIVLGHNDASVAAGDWVKVLVFEGLV